MGRDKARLEVEGEPQVRRVARALGRTDAAAVVAVGGDGAALRRLGVPWVPDAHPGEGPLGGLLTALDHLAGDAGPGTGPADVVLVVACDLIAPSPDAMAATVAALVADDDADVAVPRSPPGPRGGRLQWTHAAWRARARAPLDRAFTAGERAIHRAVTAAGLRPVEVVDLPPAALADADTPGDLP